MRHETPSYEGNCNSVVEGGGQTEGEEDAQQRLQTEAAAGGDGAEPLHHDLHPDLRHQAVSLTCPTHY